MQYYDLSQLPPDEDAERADLEQRIRYGIPPQAHEIGVEEFLAQLGTATPEDMKAMEQRYEELGGTAIIRVMTESIQEAVSVVAELRQAS